VITVNVVPPSEEADRIPDIRFFENQSSVSNYMGYKEINHSMPFSSKKRNYCTDRLLEHPTAVSSAFFSE